MVDTIIYLRVLDSKFWKRVTVGKVFQERQNILLSNFVCSVLTI